MKRYLGKVHQNLKSSIHFCRVSQIHDDYRSEKSRRSYKTSKEDEYVSNTFNENEVNEIEVPPMIPVVSVETSIKRQELELPELVTKTCHDHDSVHGDIPKEQDLYEKHENTREKQVQKTWLIRSLPDVTGKTPTKEFFPDFSQYTESEVDSRNSSLDDTCKASKVNFTETSIISSANYHNENRSICTANNDQSVEYDHQKLHIALIENKEMNSNKSVSPVRLSPFRSRMVLIDPLDNQLNDYERGVENKIKATKLTQGSYESSNHETVEKRVGAGEHHQLPIVKLRPTPKPVIDDHKCLKESPWKVKLRPISKEMGSDFPKSAEKVELMHFTPPSFDFLTKSSSKYPQVEAIESHPQNEEIRPGDIIDLSNLPQREFPSSDKVYTFAVMNIRSNKSQIVLLSQTTILIASKCPKSTSLGDNSFANAIWFTKFSAVESLSFTGSSEITISGVDGSSIPLLFETSQESISFLQAYTDVKKMKSTALSASDTFMLLKESNNSELDLRVQLDKSFTAAREDEVNTAAIIYKLSDEEYEYVVLLRKMQENGMSKEAILHRLDTENATDQIKNIIFDDQIKVERSPTAKEPMSAVEIKKTSDSSVTLHPSSKSDETAQIKAKLDNMFAPKINRIQNDDKDVMESLRKYQMMLKRGLHEDQVKHAMRRDGVNETLFDLVFSTAHSDIVIEKVPSPLLEKSKLSNEDETVASKYRMMLQIGLQKDQVRHKMNWDNIDTKIIDYVCGIEHAKNVIDEIKLSPPEEQIASEYRKMLKFGLHEDQVRHKMNLDKIDKKIIDVICKSSVQKKVSPKRKRDSNLIRLHVETISNPNPDSVWSTAKKRKQGDDKVINVFLLEDLFKKKPMLPKQSTKQASDRFNIGLSGKTMQNVGVVLQKFKQFSIEELIEIIRDLDSKSQIQDEYIELMTGLIPTDENDKLLLSNFQGETNDLSPVEVFLLKLSSIARVDEKIKAIKSMTTFKLSCETLASRFQVLINSCREVIESDRLRDIMIIARDVGNKMNEGNYSGEAEGIKFSSLLKLSETKGNDGKTTVLDFIVARLIENGKQDTLNIAQDCPTCTEASRIFITDLVCEKSNLESSRRICKTEELKKRKEESDSGKPFTKGLIKLGKFLKETENDLDGLEILRNRTKVSCMVSQPVFCSIIFVLYFYGLNQNMYYIL